MSIRYSMQRAFSVDTMQSAVAAVPLLIVFGILLNIIVLWGIGYVLIEAFVGFVYVWYRLTRENESISQRIHVDTQKLWMLYVNDNNDVAGTITDRDLAIIERNAARDTLMLKRSTKRSLQIIKAVFWRTLLLTPVVIFWFVVALIMGHAHVVMSVIHGTINRGLAIHIMLSLVEISARVVIFVESIVMLFGFKRINPYINAMHDQLRQRFGFASDCQITAIATHGAVELTPKIV